MGDDECLHIHLADCGQTDHSLYIFRQLGITAEDGIQRRQPFLHALIAWGHSRDSGDVVTGPMLLLSVLSLAKVVGAIRCVQQKPIGIQLGSVDFQHRTGLLQGGCDILGQSAIDHKAEIIAGILIGLVGSGLFISQAVGSFLGSHCRQNPGSAVGLHCGPCVLFQLSGLSKLAVGQFLCSGLCTRLGFLPADAVVADIVRGGRIAKLLAVLPCQNSGLSHIGIVVRLQCCGFGPILLRRYISRLALYLIEKGQGAAPDGIQFTVLQRWIAFFGLFQITGVGFFCVAVALEQASGGMGHCAVSATLRDGIALGIGSGETLLCCIVRKELRQGDAALMELHDRLGRTEEESGRIQRIGIEVREILLYLCFGIGVCLCIGHRLNGEYHMETGPWRTETLHQKMVAAVMHHKGHIRECRCHILRGNPVCRFIRVVVVTVHRKGVCADKIPNTAVVITIGGIDMVEADSLTEGVGISNLDLMRVQTVDSIAHAVGVEHCKSWCAHGVFSPFS